MIDTGAVFGGIFAILAVGRPQIRFDVVPNMPKDRGEQITVSLYVISDYKVRTYREHEQTTLEYINPMTFRVYSQYIPGITVFNLSEPINSSPHQCAWMIRSRT